MAANYAVEFGASIVINAISFITMKTIAFDRYVLDTLMPDLVGHDKRPAAFVVYLFFLAAASRRSRDTVTASLQMIAVRTGLSKSAVQDAIRHLKRRGLIDSELSAAPTSCIRRVLRPWIRAEGGSLHAAGSR